MKTFHCDRCDQLVFFENSKCLRCEAALGYRPGTAKLESFDADGENANVRPCANYRQHGVCNWLVDAGQPADALCVSCQLTRTLPDLGVPGNKQRWFRLEIAKRRLLYSLMRLGLPFDPRGGPEAPGLAFDFLASSALPEGQRVHTGHVGGVITIDVAEADGDEREHRRAELGEPYRTVLGHLRHETGHYYWEWLSNDAAWTDSFRAAFGDERQDYAASLARHYQEGPPADWSERHLSAYASCHPWEDWAETWAHYLHMTDVLETAAACGLALEPARLDEPDLSLDPRRVAPGSRFETLIESWYPLTYVLNSLNRGLGQPDAYPFVLSPGAVEKLRFVHGALTQLRARASTLNPALDESRSGDSP